MPPLQLNHQCLRPAQLSDWKIAVADSDIIQYGNRPSLLLEPIAVLLLDLLDRHDAAQACVPRLPHFPHPSGADGREDFVRAEFSAACECHFFSKEVQLRITLKGAGDDSMRGAANKNRLPSGLTSKTDMGMSK